MAGTCPMPFLVNTKKKKNAWDKFPQIWIINYLKMNKISDEVINFIEKSMKTCRVELTAGEKGLAEVRIQRGIFRGYAISLLLFELVIMPLNPYLRNSQSDTNFVNCKKRSIT